MKTQARHFWSCTISIPRRKRLTPDRLPRCPRRSTNSMSFSPAWDQVPRQNDAFNQSLKVAHSSAFCAAEVGTQRHAATFLVAAQITRGLLGRLAHFSQRLNEFI